MLTATNNKLYSDSSSTQDESLVSLLRCCLPSMDTTNASSQSYCFQFPPAHTFEQPFDDPRMEPVPLGLRDVASDQMSTLSESIFSIDDDLVSPSSAELEEPTEATSDLGNYMIDILEPIISLSGSKRNSRDEFSGHDEGRINTKRQRTNPVRFRPYQEQQWHARFQKLVEYKNETGHCCVPHPFPQDKALSRWVKRQRYQYKKLQNNDPSSTMTMDRIKQLESIGFAWNSHNAIWQERLDELKLFKQRAGHCNVPSHFPENEALSTWVKCQRRQWKKCVSGSRSSSMTTERFEALEALGFVFDFRTKLRFEGV